MSYREYGLKLQVLDFYEGWFILHSKSSFASYPPIILERDLLTNDHNSFFN